MSELAATLHDSPRRPGERAAGDVLDQRYRLVSRIGRGGFGDVWRAEELLPDGAPFREVALKLLAAGGDEGSWAEEAKLLASFRHPSLVTIYAAGILATTPPQRFVAMELLEGQNLADLLKVRGRVPWRRALRWACNTAAALDVIHVRGVVHLDLKPANLFLCTDGALKVLDFGISRRAGSKAVMLSRGRPTDALATLPAADAEMGTAVFLAQNEAFADTQAFTPENVGSRAAGTQHAVVGTPGFIAPEVLEMAEPTAAADAYALAVCLVQIITGRLPHAAEDEPERWDDPTEVSAWLDGLRQATLRGALREFDADPRLFPRGLAATARRLLAIDPQQRGVVPGALGELLDGAWQRPHGVPDPPYPGLAAFGPELEGLLFGRDDDIARLGRELAYEPSLVLQGAHGAGKSSLAAAGLVPYLGLRGVDGKDNWIAARVVPGDDPDKALVEALDAIEPELAKASPAEIAAHCARAPVGIVLLVDPLEELLAAPSDRRRAIDALIAAIAAATAVADPEASLAAGDEPVSRRELLGCA
jgi:serine/threonine protein kinase